MRFLLFNIFLFAAFSFALSQNQADIYNLDDSYCSNATSVTLDANPPGGTFTGPGISGWLFSPQEAGIGTHTIKYQTVFEGESYVATQTVVVQPPDPSPVTIEAPDESLTVTFMDGAFWAKGSPGGGVFTSYLYGYSPQSSIPADANGEAIMPIPAGDFNNFEHMGLTYVVQTEGHCPTKSDWLSLEYYPNTGPKPYLGLSGYYLCHGFVDTINAQVGNLDYIENGRLYLLDSTKKIISLIPPFDAENNYKIATGTLPLGHYYLAYVANIMQIYGNVKVLTGDVKDFYINAPVTPVFMNLKDQYCANEAWHYLGFSPALPQSWEDTYTHYLTGPGTSDSDKFNPQGLSGDVTLTLSGNYYGCPYSVSKTTNVLQPVTPTISAPQFAFCPGADVDVPLTGSPPGGVFSGTNVTGNTFNPHGLLPNTNITITYSGVWGGCGAYSTTKTMSINSPSSSSFGVLHKYYCTAESPDAFTISPVGGTLTGLGISGTDPHYSFAPSAITNADTVTLVHTGVDMNGCAYENEYDIYVFPQNFQAKVRHYVSDTLCLGEGAFKLVGIPDFLEEGVTTHSWSDFLGDGLAGPYFSPDDAGWGTHTITYKAQIGEANDYVCHFTATTTLYVYKHTSADPATTPASCVGCGDGKVDLNIINPDFVPLFISLNDGPYQPILNEVITGLSGGHYTANIRHAKTAVGAPGVCDTTFNFTITELSGVCGTPYGLNASPVQNNAENVKWQPIPTAVTYTIRYRKQNAPNWMTLTSQATNRTLTMLEPNTYYEWSVRANCINTGAGAYAETQLFKTGAAIGCSAPGAPISTNILPTKAYVSWNAVSGASYYRFQYRKMTNNAWTSVVSIQPNLDLTGLSPAVSYVIRVSAVCGNQESAPSLTTIFQTPFTKDSDNQWVENAKESAPLLVYPNPNSGAFTLRIVAEKERSAPVRLFDATGRLVWSQDFDLTEGENELRVETEIAAGLYLLQVNDKTIRLIVD